MDKSKCIKSFFKKLGIIILITVILSIIGLLALCFSYCISIGVEKDTFKRSQEVFRNEDVYPFISDSSQSMLDNWTDSLLVLTASYKVKEGESVAQSAMINPRYTVDGIESYNTITADLSGDSIDVTTYGRYWHGYLIFLRPLLNLFDYGQIRIINTVIQLTLLAFLIILMIKKKYYFLIIPFLAAYAFINPITITKCLQYSHIWYIVLISSICYLLFQEKIIKHNIHYLLFAIVGICTGYFDMLSYPIVGLGTLLILVLTTEEHNFIEAIKKIIICSLSWVAGYSLMWILGILYASIITGQKVYIEAIDALIYRTSNVGINDAVLTYGGFFEKLFGELDYGLIAVISAISALLGFAYLIYQIIKNIDIIKGDVNFAKNEAIRLLVLLSMTLIPIVWFLFILNHSYIHTFFAFRVLFVFFFAIYLIPFKLGFDISKNR